MKGDNIIISIKDNLKKNKKLYGVVFLLLTFGLLICFWLLVGRNQNVYYDILDNACDDIINELNNYNKKLAKPHNISAAITADSNFANEDINKRLETMQFNINGEVDYLQKTMKIIYNEYDNDQNIFNLITILKEDNMYQDFAKLSAEYYKVEGKNYKNIWNINNKIDLIKELNSIIKNNLKKEYFTQKNEKIVVSNKKISVKKHVMSLSGEDVYNIKKNILLDIKNNKRISNTIDLFGISKKEFDKQIDNLVDSLSKNNSNLITEIYINKKNKMIEKIVLNLNDEVIEINKKDNNNYIIYNNNKELGYVIKNNNNLKFSLKYKEIYMLLEKGNDSNDLLLENKNNSLEIKMERNDNNGHIEILQKKGKENAAIKIDYTRKDINNVKIYNDISEIIEKKNYNEVKEEMNESSFLLKLLKESYNLIFNFQT